MGYWNDRDYSVGKIYFIHCPQARAVKIGFSHAPDKRLKALQTAVPFPLVLLGTISGALAGEKALHREFSKYRLDGEWFKTSKVLMRKIRERLDDLGESVV